MKVEFADSFWKSLRKLRIRNAWWYKVYEFFRRNIWWFLGNIWRFRKELYGHRPWDYMYSLSIFRCSLEQLCDNIEKYGNEIEIARFKKIEKMKRAIEILKWHENDSFLELAEKQMDIKYKYGKIIGETNDITDDERKTNLDLMSLSFEIERNSFNELFEILKGQDYKMFNRDVDFNTLFDGTGINTWWD